MCTPSEALGGLTYVCEINHPFEGRLAHRFTFDRSAFMTFLADIALTGLEMEEFISPTILELLDVAISGEGCGLRAESEGETVFVWLAASRGNASAVDFISTITGCSLPRLEAKKLKPLCRSSARGNWPMRISSSDWDLEPYHEVNVDTEVNFFQGRRHSAPLGNGRTGEQVRYRKFCRYEAYRLDGVRAPISIKNT